MNSQQMDSQQHQSLRYYCRRLFVVMCTFIVMSLVFESSSNKPLPPTRNDLTQQEKQISNALDISSLPVEDALSTTTSPPAQAKKSSKQQIIRRVATLQPIYRESETQTNTKSSPPLPIRRIPWTHQNLRTKTTQREVYFNKPKPPPFDTAVCGFGTMQTDEVIDKWVPALYQNVITPLNAALFISTWDVVMGDRVKNDHTTHFQGPRDMVEIDRRLKRIATWKKGGGSGDVRLYDVWVSSSDDGAKLCDGFGISPCVVLLVRYMCSRVIAQTPRKFCPKYTLLTRMDMTHNLRVSLKSHKIVKKGGSKFYLQVGDNKLSLSDRYVYLPYVPIYNNTIVCDARHTRHHHSHGGVASHMNDMVTFGSTKAVMSLLQVYREAYYDQTMKYTLLGESVKSLRSERLHVVYASKLGLQIRSVNFLLTKWNKVVPHFRNITASGDLGPNHEKCNKWTPMYLDVAAPSYEWDGDPLTEHGNQTSTILYYATDRSCVGSVCKCCVRWEGCGVKKVVTVYEGTTSVAVTRRTNAIQPHCEL
eukprot:PhF_6_TR26982/c0_g1_i3/m.39381